MAHMIEQHSEPDVAGAASSGKALEARKTVVRFGGHRVLGGVSVRVVPGKVVGIAGPNGSGKTTLLRAMAGLIRLHEGATLIGGTDMITIPPKERARKIAYMPQSTADHSFTVLEFVLMGRYPHLGRFRLEGRLDVALAEAAMRRTETLEFAERRLQTLSGGEKQRVSLARLLVQQADFLLLDEPTASLDMRHQLLTMAMAREEARRGAGVAVVLHDLSLAARHCDRLVLLNEGKVNGEGDPWDVVTLANLRNVFSVDAAVEPEPISGKPSVSVIGLTGQTGDRRDGEPSRVHIICGAGSGRDLMHRLALAGHTVSACVLGQGDADSETAVRLSIEHIPSSPFSVISLEQDAAHRNLVREADVVVVCEMAVGPGNLRNLEAAAEAKRLMLIERPKDSQWDYTEGYAGRVYDELLTRGEVVQREDVPDAVHRVI